MSLKQFARFPELPAEVRFKIWGFTELNRIVRCQDSAKDKYTYRFGNHVPASLHACQESRREGLKRYKLFFEHPSDAKETFCPPFYFGMLKSGSATKEMYRAHHAEGVKAEWNRWLGKRGDKEQRIEAPEVVLCSYLRGTMEAPLT